MRRIAVVKFAGGLGNQMFQFAFGEYLKSQGISVYYSAIWNFVNNKELSLLKFKIKIRRLSLASSIILHFINKFNFFGIRVKEKIPFSVQDISISKFKYYEGYWQHIFYLDRNYLIDCFKYKIINPSVNNLMSSLSTNSVGIHVRRGDYVNNPTHETIGIKYFSDAIKYINNKVQEPYFFIISDDITWCKENLNFDNCTFIDFSNNEFEDFEILKNCQHKIISNSTFSWWAAFLGEIEGSITICPKKWTNKIESISLQLPNWILIS